jgi:phosphate uptake regulator
VEYRKIQKLGQNSFAISLPKEWIEKHGLKPKDSLLIRETNLDLVISNPNVTAENPEPVVSFPYNSNVRRNITMAYLVGAPQITVQKEPAEGPFSTEEREEIKSALQSLVGTQIVAEDSSNIAIDFLTTIDQEDLVQRVRQIYTLVMSMLEGLESVIQGETPKPDALKNIIARDIDVNRLYFSIVRQIRGLAKESPAIGKLRTPLYKVVDYRLMVHILENLGDCCVIIAKEFLRIAQSGGKELLPAPLYDAFKAYAANTVFAHQQAQTAFIQTNSDLIQEIIRHSTAEIGLRVEVEQALHELVGRPEIIGFFWMFSNLQQIYQYAMDICDLIE